MTQEDKELLLKYICMALPYGVIVQYKGHNTIIKNKVLTGSDLDCNMEYYKPYLRPMSSMSEEEKEEFDSLWNEGFGEALDAQLNGQNDLSVKTLEITASYKSIQWLLKKHFDFMGLIGYDLAIPVTKENNPYKE